MRTLKTSEAAALLNVSPNTLRAWEERFGYPRPQRSPGRHRLYTYAEIDALRGALSDGLSVSSAVSAARDAVTTDVHALVMALSTFKRARADAVMEASLALGSMENAVDGLLLVALEQILGRRGRSSAPWEFAASWAADWLRRAQRLVAVSDRHAAVLIGQATRGASDPDIPYIRGLELFCERAGIETLSLTVTALGALHEVIAALRPDVLIIAGSAAADDDVARWAYGVRSMSGMCPIATFRRPAPAASTRATTVWLPDLPSAAQADLFGLLVERRASRSPSRIRRDAPRARLRVGVR
jgi:DNA-binding transcriptional MerR regulator